MEDQPKTHEQLKAFLKNELEKENPKLLKDFEEIWQAMSPMLKTEGQVLAFLNGYNK